MSRLPPSTEADSGGPDTVREAMPSEIVARDPTRPTHSWCCCWCKMLLTFGGSSPCCELLLSLRAF